MEIANSALCMTNAVLTISAVNDCCYTIWPVWNQIYTTGSTSSNGIVSYRNVWPLWNENVCFANNYLNVNMQSIVQPISAEAIQAYTEQERIAQAGYAARAVEINKQRAEADDRATGLLLAHLSPDQRKQYEKDQFFEVHVADKKGIRRYRVTHGWAGNVFLVDAQGKKIKKFCIHSTKSVPYADNLLAQKLLLEADEERFLSIANHLAA